MPLNIRFLQVLFCAVLYVSGYAHADDLTVIAHRGASGLYPEHSLPGFRYAIDVGSNYIEPDLVMSKDGVLIVRHDVTLSQTTDIADHSEFADRKRTLQGITDWFVFDFTWDELQTLRVRQPRDGRNKAYDNRFKIINFDTMIDLVIADRRRGYPVGLFPEIKHPRVFRQLGLDPMPALLKAFAKIQKNGIPTYLQSFDGAFLLEIETHIMAPLVLLVEAKEDEQTGRFVPSISLDIYQGQIDGVGVDKRLVWDSDYGDTGYVGQLHEAGFKVFLWTLRDDEVGDGFGKIEDELKAYYGLGVDGIFTDYPVTALQFKEKQKLLLPPEFNEAP